MKQKFHYPALLVLGISFTLFACNSGDKKTEPATNDTATKTTAPVVMAKDAVSTAPGYYKLLKDTMGISIIEVHYLPGDSSDMHSHRDYAVYAIGDATATFYGKDGKGMENTMPAGTFMIRGAEEHSVKNSGKTPINVILVEVNRPNKPMTWETALDATKTAPDNYKLIKDTLGLRAIEIFYKPGQSAAMHAHPDLAMYVLEGSTGEFTSKDGKKTRVDFQKGMFMIAPSEAHSVKNVGRTNMRAIMVEVNRAAN